MIISAKDLKVTYRSGADALTVLDIPSWEVAEGAQVALSGPSGSGKSTLLNVVAGLLAPSGGTVTVAGTELARLGEAARDRFRARSVGYIFQNFNLLQGYTALENVLLGKAFSPRKSGADARQLLESVGLSHRERHYPRELSIGEQQRVAIARALAKRPEILLADEPTGSLDPKHTMGVVATLRDVSRGFGCTLVVVSHEEDVASAFEERVSFLELNRAFAEKGGGE